MFSFPNRDHRLSLGTLIKKKFKREQVYVRVKIVLVVRPGTVADPSDLSQSSKRDDILLCNFLLTAYMYQLLLKSMCVDMVVTIDTTLIG